MALGLILLTIFFNENFLELYPRMFECKTCHNWSFFIDKLLLLHFSEFLFPRLVLVFLGTKVDIDGLQVLDTSFAAVVDSGSSDFRLEMLEQRGVVDMAEFGWMVGVVCRVGEGWQLEGGPLELGQWLETILCASSPSEYFLPFFPAFSLLRTFSSSSGIKNVPLLSFDFFRPFLDFCCFVTFHQIRVLFLDSDPSSSAGCR
jgi:hypothetical protein